jgi:uncharacterized protein
MKDKILNSLADIEKKYNVKIVMAIESGSRAWGFSSDDSDFDVRCVHVGEIDNYIGLEGVPKQINEFKDELDIESWDIKKFAELSLKSNPQIEEWIRSKIVYIDRNFLNQFRSIFDGGCSKNYLRVHYLNMAKQNYSKYMSIGLAHSCKKYLYVLRAIACANFIEKHNKLPPLHYKEVIPCLPEYARKFFEKCVITKNLTEKAEITPNKNISDFIERNIFNVNKQRAKEEYFSNKEELNDFVISKIREFGKR